jgi:hypothetical protein
MSTPEDNDDDWREEEHKIATTPEALEDLMRPIRGVDGAIRTRFHPEYGGPHPHVYRSVFEPSKYRWRQTVHDYEVHPRYASMEVSQLHRDAGKDEIADLGKKVGGDGCVDCGR